MYAPFNYSQINVVEGSYSPSTYHVDSLKFDYYCRTLFQRACYSIEFKNLPWSGEIHDFFIWCMFRYGYVAVFNHKTYGLMFQPCTLAGLTVYYQPSYVLVTNPALIETLELTLGEEAELIKLTPDYLGVWDIITNYAAKLAELDNGIRVSLINNKTPNILAGKNKAASEALKVVADRISKGESTVVYDKLLQDVGDGVSPFQSMEREHIKDSYITDMQLKDFQTILNQFDNEVGIPTVPYEKKERMVTSEAESRVVDSQARITIWLETLNTTLETVNKHFGTSITAEKRVNPEEVQTDGRET